MQTGNNYKHYILTSLSFPLWLFSLVLPVFKICLFTIFFPVCASDPVLPSHLNHCVLNVWASTPVALWLLCQPPAAS